MRKNGFTLIELLAVIVILAIIALIATPIILGIINDAREESNERSVELYASAVRNGIAAYQLREGKEVLPDTYTSTNPLPFEVEYDGKVDCENVIISETGKVSLDKCTVNGGTKEYSYGKKQGSDVVKLCTANTTKATALVWRGNADSSQETSYDEQEVGLLASVDGAYTTGVVYTCNFIDDSEENNMTFFVLSSTGNEVTLIAGSNLGSTIAWSEDGSNHKDDPEEMQALTVKAVLADRTSGWNKLTAAQKATIKLPTKDQIESAYEGTMPKWVYGNLTYNTYQGYWTSTPSGYDSGFEYVWVVNCTGDAGIYSDHGLVTNDVYYGIRPVITISTSDIR